jgi:hypothetical protein
MGRSKQLFDQMRMDQIFNQSNQINNSYMSEPTTDALKLRVIKAKEKLPKSIIPVFVHVFKEYDNEDSRTRLSNVLQLRVSDKFITEKLEQLINILKVENNV